MGWRRTIWPEIFSLFVDDARFALSIAAWLLLIGLLPALGMASGWAGAILIAGLALILFESVTRRARGFIAPRLRDAARR